MTPDCDEIDRLVDWAEASHIAGDGEWNQTTTAHAAPCGTAYCIAGKWGADHGWRYDFIRGWLDPDRNEGDVLTAAERGLGVTERQAYGVVFSPGLFSALSAIDDLRRIAKEIRTEAGQ